MNGKNNSLKIVTDRNDKSCMNTFSGRMFYENEVRVCFPLRLGCWIILISTIEVCFF